jgi:hypothetical protein
MEGLAQQMAGAPAQQMAPQGGGQEQMAMIEQIIAMLMQGVDPEELIQQGIPPELIMAAIDMLEQQLAAQGQQQAAQPMQQAPQGLAQSMM